MQAVAIVVAGGMGRRCGGDIPKQFQSVGGRSLLERALRAVAGAESVGEIVLVVPPDQVQAVKLKWRGFLSKPLSVVAGGECRQDSVAHGLAATTGPDDRVVAVHDAARPFVSSALFDSCVRVAQADRACIVAMPAADTIKRVEAGVISATLPRDFVWQAQTPQSFHRLLLVRAMEGARARGERGTDEASLVEAMGVAVKVIRGDPWNIKVTTPGDMVVAEAIAKVLDQTEEAS